ncbi:hypothetical protein BS47DRAFT_719223 [Hydnum rufescens UP504]|uniref:Secreted protein n=1 Tax=Hydnum rufescens UP504 TaxID=1448309 RepID=A0A9P6DYV9_9AGAM|nr:hypothetical protein BS47DRAFT_719223 [Hydnum rufescens UP504]
MTPSPRLLMMLPLVWSSLTRMRAGGWLSSTVGTVALAIVSCWSRIMSTTHPMVPFATSLSVSMLVVTMTCIPTASSTILANFAGSFFPQPVLAGLSATAHCS